MDVDNKNTGIEVVMNVFSGRRNPRWKLTRKQVKGLVERFSGLTELEVEEAKEPESYPLEYRGMIVHNRAKNPGLPTRFTVYDSVITVGSGKERVTYPDPNDIEGFLQGLAHRHGYGRLLVSSEVDERLQ